MAEAGRVLVTGATGFVGRHCLEPLARRGFEVHAVAHRRPRPEHGRWHTADLLAADDRRRIIEEVAPTHLLHAAWYLEPGKYGSSAVNVDWVIASLDLIRRFQVAGGVRAVVLGSCYEYDWSVSVLVETAPLRPRTVYGRSKLALFESLAALGTATGLSTAWGRLFFLYGPHEKRGRLVSDVVASLLEGRAVATSHGLQRRDYMYVEDTGEAVAALVASGVEGPVNVATGSAVPVRDIVLTIASLAGGDDLVQLGARPLPNDEPDCVQADVTRLREEVGWWQVTPHDVALLRTVAWWRVLLGVSE